MTLSEIKEKAKEGYLCKLPRFSGYFKWNYGFERLMFKNGNFECLADDLEDIQNRDDFYHII